MNTKTPQSSPPVRGGVPLLVLGLAVLVTLAECSGSVPPANERPADAFDRVEGALSLTRPSDGVRDYYGSLYFGAGEDRTVDLWLLPGAVVVFPEALIFVIDEPSGLRDGDTERLVEEIEDLYPDASQPEADGANWWIDGAGPNEEGVTVGVHRGLGYIVIGGRDAGQKVLEAVAN